MTTSRPRDLHHRRLVQVVLAASTSTPATVAAEGEPVGSGAATLAAPGPVRPG